MTTKEALAWVISIVAGFVLVVMFATASTPLGKEVVKLPAYGAGMAPQQQSTIPPELEKRLADIESKLDKLLNLIEAEASIQQPGADALISGATKCSQCHLPNVAQGKGGGFTLFTNEGHFVDLQERQKQQVLKRLSTIDPNFQMPPPRSGVQLTEQERAALLSAFQQPPTREKPE